MVLTIEIIWHELETAAKITTFLLCILFAGYFLKRRRTTELKETRMVFLGQALFVLSFGLTRLLFLIADYFSEDISLNLVLWVDKDLYFLIWKISTAIGILAIIFLLIVIESYLVKNSRYFFSIVASIGLIFVLAAPDIDFGRPVTYITLPIAMGAVISLYAYLYFKSSGVLRRKVQMSLNGFIIFGIGVVADTQIGQSVLNLFVPFDPTIISVTIMALGLALYTYYNIKD